MLVLGEGEVLVPAHLNFGKFILDRLRSANPDDTCMVNCTRGEKLSYGEFTQHLVSVAAGLAALGAGRGHTVAVGGEPRVTFLPTVLAGVLAGAAVTPIELDCGRAVLAHKLNLTRPKYMICSRLFWEAYSDILKGLDFIETFISFDINEIDDIKLSVATMASRHVDVTTFEPAAVRGETDVAIVVYSSGTTGMSKGVQLTHLNCITRCDVMWYHDFASLKVCRLLSEPCIPFVIALVFHFLSAGKKVIFSEKLDLKTYLDYQVDTTSTIPVIVEEIINTERADEYNLSSMRIMYCGSGPLRPAVSEAINKRYPNLKLLQVYGATEVGPITVQEPSHTKSTSVGMAVPGVTIKVVDVETRATLGPNQRGEICVRSPCLMKGYLGASLEYLDDQGFFLTGDLGYYDDQKHFYLVDRLRDLICYKTKKVSPGEVEAVLLRHSAVRECAVVGKPAGAAGELPVAFVALRPGAHATQADLVHYVDKEVSSYMRLRGGVRFVSELPRSPRQKILRRRLREMLELEELSDNSLEPQ